MLHHMDKQTQEIKTTPSLTYFYGALLVPYTHAYTILLLANTFLPFARLFLLARLFFCWRDFFFAGATFFCWRDFFFAGATFFFAGATFFCWRDFFLLARLFFLLARLFFAGATFFFAGATFFCWRDFSSLARLFSLPLICRPLLDFIAGSKYEHVWLSKMADSADKDLGKASGIYCSSE